MSAPNRRFALHYLEMVAVMFLGMGVLWLPAELALGAVGSGWNELLEDLPALGLLLMAGTMTGPMIAWMRYRGHGWRPCIEMGAAMIVPTLGAIGLIAVGAAEDGHGVMLVEHVAMLTAMLAVMLARPEEYSRHHGYGSRHEVSA